MCAQFTEELSVILTHLNYVKTSLLSSTESQYRICIRMCGLVQCAIINWKYQLEIERIFFIAQLLLVCLRVCVCTG